MRRKDREVSAEQAWEIVERCSYGVLAMTKPDGTPYAVPVNFAREGNCLYIHCAQAGEKTDCLNHQPQVCVTCVEGGRMGGPAGPDHALRLRSHVGQSGRTDG